VKRILLGKTLVNVMVALGLSQDLIELSGRLGGATGLGEQDPLNRERQCSVEQGRVRFYSLVLLVLVSCRKGKNKRKNERTNK